ncbi:MAG TPA: DUF1800 domain-containing protein [Bryobacteraceae bacterium]|nr:DUF1800 domain-containing protein [Bryobacteraceae bacterium]
MKVRALVATSLASFLLVLPGVSSTKSSKASDDAKKQAKLFEKKLKKDDQILHALDRLTFGPRPGDVERVKKMGLKKWIDQQLHPESIKENPDLEAKLQPLESLRMTPMETVQHYPPPQMIKAIADGRQPMPDDPILRASIERYMTRFKVKKGQDAAAGKNGAVVDPNADMEPAKPLDQVLEPAEIQVVRTGTPDKKRELLASLPADKLEDMLIALPRPQRQQLFNFAPTDVRRKILLLNAPQQVVAYDLLESKLLRATESNRQLAEELDDFWFNHFNVYYDKGSDRFLIPNYEREAIRPNVLGKFRDLLEATAKSPAMLFYLDNFQSVRPDIDVNAKNRKVKRGLNENYGRELMELHTLGVNGGYTQQDVREVARCFTGWTLLEPRRGGGFFYNDRLHDKGEKTVLGHVIPAGGGMDDAEKVLDILATHPSTAHFISRKLAQRFVADNPPDALVEKMAAKFLASNGDIREVMKVMLDSKEFWSEGAYRAKVKTPFEMVASSVRALDAEVTDAWALANQVGNLGEPLYRKQEPTGYSNLNAEWVNSAALLSRMNFALQLARNGVPGVKVDVSQFGSDPMQVAKVLMFRSASPQTRAAIEKAVADQKQKTPALVAGLVIGSPDFQRR